MDKSTGAGYQKDQIWPSLVSVFAPLIQLFVVFSASLSGILNIKNYFLFPDLINLVNFLNLFIILSFIGIYWYWRNNSYIVAKPKKDKAGNAIFISPDLMVFNTLKYLAIITSLLFLIFIYSLFAVLYKTYIWNTLVTAIVQYVSYSTVIITSGIIIYIWFYEYIRKNQTFQREDFLRNLLNTLSSHGIVKPQPVKIWKNVVAQGYINRIVWVQIDSENYVIQCSFDGLEISEIFTKEEYDKSQGIKG